MGPPFPATVSIATASQARNRRPALSPGGPGRAALALVRPPPRMVQRWLVSRHVAESLARHVWPSVPLVGRGTRRDGAILQVSGCTGQDRARRQRSSPGELEPRDRAADLAPITLLDSGCMLLVGVRCLRAIGPLSTKPRRVAKLSARAGILRVKCLISGTGPGRPSRGPEAYDPRTAENITNRDTSCAGPRNRPPDRPRD